ncbi:hypothetical protein Tco_0262422 [Tanacetum coccineum]
MLSRISFHVSYGRRLSLVPILNSLRPFKQPYKPCSLRFVNRFAKNSGMVLDRLMIQTRLAVYKFEYDELAWWKAYEQTKKFRWSFHKSILDHLMCILFIDIAQFADVAHNLEILHDTEDYDGSEQSGKKDSGECRHAARNCFKYGQTGHLQQDDKKDTATSTSGHADKETRCIRPCLCNYAESDH